MGAPYRVSHPPEQPVPSGRHRWLCRFGVHRWVKSKDDPAAYWVTRWLVECTRCGKLDRHDAFPPRWERVEGGWVASMVSITFCIQKTEYGCDLWLYDAVHRDGDDPAWARKKPFHGSWASSVSRAKAAARAYSPFRSPSF